ncbi:MAG: serine/threonine protein kinase, partial [Planctomycetota bacterium]
MISQIGNYHIIKLLGKGSMGAVYLAMSSSSEVVALKVVKKELSEDQMYLQRFMREIQVVQNLNHPNIVRTLDYGVDMEQDALFAVMEFIDGPDVNQLIQRFEALQIHEAFVILAQAAKGLDYAGKQNLVHRDIKPANLLLNKKGFLKIADFGLVKDHQNESITQTGTALGSPAYMSPEQIMGENTIDIRSDIYSLGVVFFKMVTGKLPYFSKRSSD